MVASGKEPVLGCRSLGKDAEAMRERLLIHQEAEELTILAKASFLDTVLETFERSDTY